MASSAPAPLGQNLHKIGGRSEKGRVCINNKNVTEVNGYAKLAFALADAMLLEREKNK
jgi:hypothetical protein